MLKYGGNHMSVNQRHMKPAKPTNRTWRTQCVNYLAWGVSNLTKEDAIERATLAHDARNGEPIIVDDAAHCVYYRAQICL